MDNKTVPKKKHEHYMPALDGIRGFACMLVIISHIGCFILALLKPFHISAPLES